MKHCSAKISVDNIEDSEVLALKLQQDKHFSMVDLRLLA
jgi:hypothetical protein